MNQSPVSFISSIWSTDVQGVCTRVAVHVDAILPSMEGSRFIDWLRAVRPDTDCAGSDAVVAAIGQQAAFRHEHAIRCQDGRLRWVVTTGLPRRAADGSFAGFDGAILDATQSMEASAQAAGSAAEARIIVDNCMDLIAHCDENGNYLHVSRSYTDVVGWEPHEMVGEQVVHFLHPADQERAAAALRRVFAGDEILDVVEVRKRGRDGRYVSLGTKVRAVCDPVTRRVVGAIIVSRDITREKEMLHRIERMAEQSAALIENSPDVMLLLNLEGRILHANKAVSKLLGYEADELGGRDASCLLGGEDDAAWVDNLAALRRHEGFLSGHVLCRCRNGTVRRLDWSLRRPPGSELIYATARDITEKHRTALALEQAHVRLRTILESIEDGFFSINKRWEITYANTLGARYVGLDEGAPSGRTVWEAAPGLAGSALASLCRTAMKQQENVFAEVFHEDAAAWLSVRVYVHGDGLSVFFHDISNRIQNDRLIRESEHRFRQMIGLTPAAYLVIDADGLVQETNPALCQLLGYKREELLGAAIGDIVVDDGVHGALRMGETAFPTCALEAVVRHKHGHTLHVLVNQAIERSAQGEALSLTAFLTDITERKRTEARLEQLATHDVLTGLPNRAWFNRHLAAMLADTGGSGTDTVLFIDLNRFKAINDSLGHAAGDSLLQQVSQRLQSCMRPGDVVARLGGDEFVVAARCTGRAGAAAIASRLIASLSSPFHFDGVEMHVGASVGISMADRHAGDADTLFRHADEAMYRAKAAGESTYRFFEAATDDSVP